MEWLIILLFPVAYLGTGYLLLVLWSWLRGKLEL